MKIKPSIRNKLFFLEVILVSLVFIFNTSLLVNYYLVRSADVSSGADDVPDTSSLDGIPDDDLLSAKIPSLPDLSGISEDYSSSISYGPTQGSSTHYTAMNWDASSPEEYISTLESYISEMGYDVGLGFINLTTGYTYTYRPDDVFYGASLAKTVAAMYIYENYDIDPDWYHRVYRMIYWSDNNVYRDTVDLIGWDTLYNYGHYSLGLVNYLEGEYPYFGDTSVRDQLIIWSRLWNDTCTLDNGIELRNHFDNDSYNVLSWSVGYRAMHKLGNLGAYHHDTGIILSDSPYIVIVLTDNTPDERVILDLSGKLFGLNELVK